MTHSGHGGEPPAPDGAVQPPSGVPWWEEAPPVAAEPGDDEATQLISPLGAPSQHHVPEPHPPAAPATYAHGDDGEATQLIPPMSDAYAPPPPAGAPAYQAPPAEEPPRTARHAAPAHTQFEGLFRDSAPSAGGQAVGDAGATQRLPQVPPRAPGARSGYGYPGPGARSGYGYPGPGARSGYGYPGPGARSGYGYPGPAAGPGGPAAPAGPPGYDPGPYYDDEEPRRSIPRWAAVAIGTAACAAVGITAGWLLSSGGDDGGSAADGATASASAGGQPADGGEKKPAADPGKAQAEKLDALLAESNDSRAAVIRSVENIRQCKALGKAASDLRAAARQRNSLVNRLAKLDLGRLSNHDRLAGSLTDAWKSSAAADNHYAAWAKAVRGKKCHGGAGHLSAGNRASGEATLAKQEAAGLWNPIAREYGLTERQAAQL